MHNVIAHLIVMAALASTKPAAATSGFDFSLLVPGLGVVLGSIISASISFFLHGRTNKQQLARDREANAQQLARDQAAYDQQFTRDQEAYKQQRERDESVYAQQKERERIAYERSLRDAKRDRLRSAYKILLKAAEAYIYILTELEYLKDETEEERNQRLTVFLHETLSGVNEAMFEVLLEDLGGEIEITFSELRQAYHRYTSSLENKQAYTTLSFAQEDLSRIKTKATQNRDKLLALMQSHLVGPP